MSASANACSPRPRRPSKSKTKINPIDPFTCGSKHRTSTSTKRSAGGYPDTWGCCICLFYILLILLAIYCVFFLLPNWGVVHWIQNGFGFSTCPVTSTGTGDTDNSGSGPSCLVRRGIGRTGNAEDDQDVSNGRGNLESESSSGQSQSQGQNRDPENHDMHESSLSNQQNNYALCEDGATIFRVNNWPPFRGEECDRGTHLIVQRGPLEENRFWQFNPVGDVEISLSEAIIVSGLTIRHPPGVAFASAPHKLEFNGIDYDSQYEEKSIHHFGDYFYTEKLKDHQTFQVTHPSNKKFQIIQIRFHNNQSNSKLSHVYKVEVHGHP